MSHQLAPGWSRTAILALGIASLSVSALAGPRFVRAATPTWLQANVTARTAYLTLIAGWSDANGGLNFDGYSNGQMVVTVPLGWHVQVTFSNRSAAPHSVEVIAYDVPVPETGFRAAFKHAQSPDPIDGITQDHQPQRVAFVAARAGRYMIICGVPGHANSGMWARFVVAKTARTATLRIRR
jgi:sulfocyanin